MVTHRQYFDEQVALFSAALDGAIQASLASAGRRVDRRYAWSTWIFSRLCATGHSLKRLLAPITSDYGTTIDHGSIGNLSRNIIEASILISYLIEDGISEDEWSCRELTLHIHDCVSRIRFFKGLGREDQVNEHRDAIKDLRSRVAANPVFKRLPKEEKEKIRGGSAIYIHGLRTAASKAGWEKGQFDAVYNYLSMQTHSAPMSFYRMEMQKIDHKTIAPYQYAFVAFALELAHQAIADSTHRIHKLFPNIAPSTESIVK